MANVQEKGYSQFHYLCRGKLYGEAGKRNEMESGKGN